AIEKGPIPAARQPGGVMLPIGTPKIVPEHDLEVLDATHSSWMAKIKNGVDKTGAVLRFDHLALTALGANAAFSFRQPLTIAGNKQVESERDESAARAATAKLPKKTLLEWTQRTLLGRDAFIRAVELVYLAPFQHRAARVEIIERKLITSGGEQVALLERKR